MPSRLVLPAILLLFFLSLLGFSVDEAVRYPDERHYVVGGAKMLASGEYLIPRTADDEVRLKKPPVPYHFMAIGFGLFGQSVLASKIAWIAASLVILVLTASLARRLGAGRTGMLAACAALASNFFFFRSGFNTIPDTPLMLFLLVATLGFVGLLFSQDAPRWSAWSAYCGVALAILSKGLLPVAFLAYSIVFVAVFMRARWRDLLNVPAIAVSAGLVLSWYGYAYLTHPAAFVTEFFGDQVTQKADFDLGSVVQKFLANPAGIAISFWPWLLLLAAVWLRGAKISGPRVPSALAYLAGWMALVVAIFAFSERLDARYMLPLYPLVAALIGVAVDRIPAEAFVAAARWPVRISAALVGVTGALSIFILLGTGAPLLASVVLLGALALVGAMLTIGKEGRDGVVLALVLTTCGLALSLAPAAYRISTPNGHARVAEMISARFPDEPKVVALDDGPKTVAGLILHGIKAGGLTHSNGLDPVDPGDFEAIVTSDPAAAEQLGKLGMRVEAICARPQKINGSKAFDALFAGRLSEYLESICETTFVAFRKPS